MNAHHGGPIVVVGTSMESHKRLTVLFQSHHERIRNWIMINKNKLPALLAMLLVPCSLWFTLYNYNRMMMAVDFGSQQQQQDMSPYERRHPWDKLPEWCKKFDVFINNGQQNHELLQKLPELCFMHIGKTGGTSLACSLGFKYDGCGDTTPPEGYLPQVTTHLTHNIFNDCNDDDHLTKTRPYYYLFATRNPLERIISWYAYEYPETRYYDKKKPLFLDCPFGTLTQMAERGLADPPILHDDGEDVGVVVTKTCQKRAWDAIRGKVPYSRHNAYNYKFYLEQTPRNAPLYVMRTEHLTEDWNSVEAHLHSFLSPDSPKYQIQGFPKQNKSFYKTAKQDRTVSPKAQELLCRGLCEEIQVYKDILRRAMNLTPEQVQESLEELKVSCPEQTVVETCPKFPDDNDGDKKYLYVLFTVLVVLVAAVSVFMSRNGGTSHPFRRPGRTNML